MHLSDFWQLFPSPSTFFFLTFSWSLSDHVIHARLHVVWTRTKGIQSQWTLTETSVKLQQNGENQSCRVWPRLPLLWCEFMSSECVGQSCRLQTKVEDMLSTNTHQHQITYLTLGTTWSVGVFDRYTCWITLPVTSSTSLSCLSYSVHVTLCSLCIINSKGQALTWKEGRSPTKLACGLFVMFSLVLYGCLFCCLQLAACLHQRTSALEVLPSHWSWQAFPRLFLLPGDDPDTLSYLDV